MHLLLPIAFLFLVVLGLLVMVIILKWGRGAVIIYGRTPAEVAQYAASEIFRFEHRAVQFAVQVWLLAAGILAWPDKVRFVVGEYFFSSTLKNYINDTVVLCAIIHGGKADERVMVENFIVNRFSRRFHPSVQRFVSSLCRDSFRQSLGRAGVGTFYEALEVFVKRHGRHPESVKTLLYLLFQLSYADGNFDLEEQDRLEIVRRALGVSLDQYERIERKVLDDRRTAGLKKPQRERSSYREKNYRKAERGEEDSSNRSTTGARNNASTRPGASKREQAFAVLGVGLNDDFSTIKKRYRTLVKEFHPDTNNHLPEKERTVLARKFQEIQTAFEYIAATWDE
jgi:DnaJ-domain-containing protein 1